MREIGIPCIYGLDQNHGTTYTMGGTLFPLKHYMGYSVPFTGKTVHRYTSRLKTFVRNTLLLSWLV